MKDSISHLHAVCEDWKKELKFFRDEIKVLRGRLEEVVSKNSNKDILAQVDHFENKFHILENHVKVLLHDVKDKENVLTGQAAAQPKHINVRMVDTDKTFEDTMLLTSKDFYDTKNEYYRFLSQVF